MVYHDSVGVSPAFAQAIIQRIAFAKQAQPEQFEPQGAIDLDSHADSPVAGACLTIIHRTGRRVNVTGFTDELGKPIRVEVVHAMVLYECSYTGKMCIE